MCSEAFQHADIVLGLCVQRYVCVCVCVCVCVSVCVRVGSMCESKPPPTQHHGNSSRIPGRVKRQESKSSRKIKNACRHRVHAPSDRRVNIKVEGRGGSTDSGGVSS